MALRLVTTEAQWSKFLNFVQKLWFIFLFKIRKKSEKNQIQIQKTLTYSKVSIKYPVLLNVLVWNFLKSLLNNQYHLRKSPLYRFSCLLSLLNVLVWIFWKSLLNSQYYFFLFWKPRTTRSYNRDLRVLVFAISKQKMTCYSFESFFTYLSQVPFLAPAYVHKLGHDNFDLPHFHQQLSSQLVSFLLSCWNNCSRSRFCVTGGISLYRGALKGMEKYLIIYGQTLKILATVLGLGKLIEDQRRPGVQKERKKWSK